jgi:hypothetical protein
MVDFSNNRFENLALYTNSFHSYSSINFDIEFSIRWIYSKLFVYIINASTFPRNNIINSDYWGAYICSSILALNPSSTE